MIIYQVSPDQNGIMTFEKSVMGYGTSPHILYPILGSVHTYKVISENRNAF